MRASQVCYVCYIGMVSLTSLLFFYKYSTPYSRRTMMMMMMMKEMNEMERAQQMKDMKEVKEVKETKKAKEVKETPSNSVKNPPPKVEDPMKPPIPQNSRTDYEVKGWEKSVDRDTKKYVAPLEDTAIFPGQHLCGPGTNIIVIVTTLPGKFTHRLLLRETWASPKIEGVSIGFFVGQAASPFVQPNLEKEITKYQDIIQEGFIDSSQNATLKSVFLLKWFLRHCQMPKYLVKVEGDTFVDVGHLKRDLAEFRPSGFLRGFAPLSRLVIRQRLHKRYVPMYMYQKNQFPPFLSGAGYIMSPDVIAKLYNASLSTPIINLEDVYITGLCAEKAGVDPQPMRQTKHIQPYSKDCLEVSSMCHSFGPEKLREVWEKRKNK